MAFDILIGLFDRFSLHTNMMKTLSMAYQPCNAPVNISSKLYKWWTTGTGTIFQESQQRRMACPKCKVKVAS